MDSLQNTLHSEFKYIKIPCDINDPVLELPFTGRESEFKDLLNIHFTQVIDNLHYRDQLHLKKRKC